MKILNMYRFAGGTNPEDESTIYILQLPDNSRRFLIISFGMYSDPVKSDLIDTLNQLETGGEDIEQRKDQQQRL